MNGNENESIESIVAEMRHGLDKSWHDIDREWARGLPTRIEAAWKREAKAIAMEHAVLPAVCINKWSGNAAAMREALERIHTLVNSLDEECGVDPIDVRDIARAALSEPARNCDLFDNWYDAHQAWECLPKDELGYFVAANGVHECEQAWLLATAAERKGEGK